VDAVARHEEDDGVAHRAAPAGGGAAVPAEAQAAQERKRENDVLKVAHEALQRVPDLVGYVILGHALGEARGQEHGPERLHGEASPTLKPKA